MEDIMECYGTGLLQILGGVGAMVICQTLFRQNGILQQILLQYLQGICS